MSCSRSFGVCPRCGRRGNLTPTTNQPYQVPNASETGSGLELRKYQGQFLCPICIEDLKDEIEDQKRINADSRFQSTLSGLGFQKS